MTNKNETLFNGKYKTDTCRLKKYDYSLGGTFFVTICTRKKIHYFGAVLENSIQLSEIGQIALSHWAKIPELHPYAMLDQFVIMPNHVHGILLIDPADTHNRNGTPVETHHMRLKDNSAANRLKIETGSTITNQFGPQRRNLASIVRGYKSSVKSYALKHEIEFGWQPRYYDRIIRNDTEYERIQEYIFYNPLKWFWEKSDDIENLNYDIIKDLF